MHVRTTASAAPNREEFDQEHWWWDSQVASASKSGGLASSLAGLTDALCHGRRSLSQTLRKQTLTINLA